MGVQTITTVETPPATYSLASLALTKARLNLPSGTNYVTSADTPSGQVLPFLATGGIQGTSPTDGSPMSVAGTNIQTGCVVAGVTATTVILSLPVAGDVPAGSVITFGNDQLLDDFLTAAVEQASWAIQKYCNRVFAVQTIQDQIYPQRDAYPGQVPGGVWMLRLSNWPLLAPNLATSEATSSGAVLNFADTTNVVPGMAAAQANIPPGTIVLDVTDETVTLSAPVSAPIAEGAVINFAPGVQVQTSPGSTCILTPGVDYIVQPQSGELMRLNKFTGYPMDWDSVPTTVTYVAGYADIPGDILDACLRLVTKMYWGRVRDPTIIETGNSMTGSTRYWFDDGSSGNLPPDIKELLNPYRVPVVG